MEISPLVVLKKHERAINPHPQYLTANDARNLFADKSDLATVVRKIAIPVVKEIAPTVVKTNGNTKGDKGDPGAPGQQGIQGLQGEQGEPGEDGGSAPHTHPISDVTNLQSSLDGKAANSHAHPISDVTNLQTTLDGKAASTHSHAQSDVTGLVAALSGKASTVHVHVINDVTNLQSTLDGKAATAHGHVIGDVTGLQAALDGKAALSHTHAQSDITGLVAALAGKSDTSHTHAGLPIMARIAADIAQSSNVTFSNLFTRAILAGEIWSFEAIIYFTSAAATTGLVVQVDSPTSPTFGQCSMCAQETVTVGRYLPAAFNATMIATAAVISPAINTALVSGTLENGANGGNIVIKFRSEVNASAITVKRGSWCKFFKH